MTVVRGSLCPCFQPTPALANMVQILLSLFLFTNLQWVFGSPDVPLIDLGPELSGVISEQLEQITECQNFMSTCQPTILSCASYVCDSCTGLGAKPVNSCCAGGFGPTLTDCFKSVKATAAAAAAGDNPPTGDGATAADEATAGDDATQIITSAPTDTSAAAGNEACNSINLSSSLCESLSPGLTTDTQSDTQTDSGPTTTSSSSDTDPVASLNDAAMQVRSVRRLKSHNASCLECYVLLLTSLRTTVAVYIITTLRTVCGHGSLHHFEDRRSWMWMNIPKRVVRG